MKKVALENMKAKLLAAHAAKINPIKVLLSMRPSAACRNANQRPTNHKLP
jgi:hypothetical protein